MATPSETPGEPRDKVVIAKRVLLLLMLAYVVTFALQNRDEVRIDFLVVSATTSLVFALALVGVLGVVVGWLLATLRGRN